MGSFRSCHLCGNEAVLRCDADSAFLCWECDAKVHGANFLVARHVRMILCYRCHEYTGISTCVPYPNGDKCLCTGCSISDWSDQNLLRNSTAESGISGRRSSSLHKTTKHGVNASNFKKCSCAEDKENPRLLEVSGNPVSEVSIDEWSWSNSEDATDSLDKQPKSQQKKPRITRHSVAVPNSDMKVQAILRRWYRYLDLRSPSTVPLAMHLVEKGLNKLGHLFRQKWRIFLAASIWLASTHCENQAHLPSIERVEECTGVASELIVKVEFRMATILDWKIQEEEGWAESSS